MLLRHYYADARMRRVVMPRPEIRCYGHDATNVFFPFPDVIIFRLSYAYTRVALRL